MTFRHIMLHSYKSRIRLMIQLILTLTVASSCDSYIINSKPSEALFKYDGNELRFVSATINLSMPSHKTTVKDGVISNKFFNSSKQKEVTTSFWSEVHENATIYFIETISNCNEDVIVIFDKPQEHESIFKNFAIVKGEKLHKFKIESVDGAVTEDGLEPF